MSQYPWRLPYGVHDIGQQAHAEDSLAPAEHVRWQDLKARLKPFENKELRPPLMLDRAWLRVEYALSTPETDHDEELFDKADQDVKTIVEESGLDIRNKVRVNAALLGAYTDIFRLRARREYIPPEAQAELSNRIGSLLVEFMDEGRPLIAHEIGPLCELITPKGLLYTGTLPYLASSREEGNTYANDNHDYYTLHPCDVNIVKKVPISVKHLEDYNLWRGKYDGLPGEPLPVATVKIGKIALETAAVTMPYAIDARYEEGTQGVVRRATRLAADIMACQALGEELEPHDQQFLTTMSLGILNPVITFANSPVTPNYTQNAQALDNYIAAWTKKRTT